MNVLDILDLLESVSGNNDKLKILREHNNNQELHELLNAALNFKRKFYIKKFDQPINSEDSNLVNHTMFMHLLNKLQSREITGNEALNKVHSFLCSCNEQQKKWYSRVIRKDLRSGFSISSANKSGFNIPEFDVMLAKDGKQCKKLNEIISNGVYVSPKLDGYRCIAVCDRGDVTLYSRNGTEYENFPTIIDELSKVTREEGIQIVLDGEIMSNTFQSMQKNAFASKRRTQVGDVEYHMFGAIPFDEWETEVFRALTADRLGILVDFYCRFIGRDNELIKHVDSEYTESLDRILELEKEYIEQGYEGAMVLPNIPYFKGKKSNRLMKFKTMLSQDCEIIGVYEGTGKYAGMMGGLNLRQEDGTACDVGSGFSDDDREWIWQNPEEVIGRIAEIKYQELTDDGVMRFPIFLKYRGDKE